MVGTRVTPRPITKESKWRAGERDERPGRPRKILLDWLMIKEYKMDYSQLKSMTEDTQDAQFISWFLTSICFTWVVKWHFCGGGRGLSSLAHAWCVHCISIVNFVTIHASDRQTDGRTDWRTELRQQYCVALHAGFLQCFDTVGLVIWPVKIVPEMTCCVSSGTLNPTHSLTYYMHSHGKTADKSVPFV